MSVYAYFDHTAGSPSPVLGWFDTDYQTYPDLPDAGDLLALEEGQKFARFDGSWAVDNGMLVPYVPVPVLTLSQQADQAQAQRLAAGIVIASTSNSDIDATYALDPTSTTQIAAIGSFAGQFGDFPDQESVFAYPDIRGVQHSFTVAQFISFWRAVATAVWGIQTQAGIMRAGGMPVWPSQSATIA